MNGKQIFVKQREVNQALFIINSGDKRSNFTQLSAKTRNVIVNGTHCLNLAWIACGRYSSTIFKKNIYWDFISGQYLVSQASGVVIDKPVMHIVESNTEFAKL